MSTPKRPFLRKEGNLIDEYRLPNGKACTQILPGAMLGEPIAAKVKKELLADAGKSAHFRLRPLSWEKQSLEHLDALLRALRAGDSAAPMALGAYLEDRRVSPAILQTARRTKLGEGANHIQVVGMLGGPGAAAFLRPTRSVSAPMTQALEVADWQASA